VNRTIYCYEIGREGHGDPVMLMPGQGMALPNGEEQKCLTFKLLREEDGDSRWSDKFKMTTIKHKIDFGKSVRLTLIIPIRLISPMAIVSASFVKSTHLSK